MAFEAESERRQPPTLRAQQLTVVGALVKSFYTRAEGATPNQFVDEFIEHLEAFGVANNGSDIARFTLSAVALLNGRMGIEDGVITRGGFSYNIKLHEGVSPDNPAFRLTSIEGRLYHTLLLGFGDFVPTSIVNERIWGNQDYAKILKTHLSHLKKKADPNSRFFKSRAGVGCGIIP